MANDLDRAYLVLLIGKRDAPVGVLSGFSKDPYYQGRIDEYCSQNALDQTDFPDLELRLTEEF